MSNKCEKCGEAEKAPGAYRFCTSCREIAEKESDARYRKKHRLNKLVPCEECGEVKTKYKYCWDCKKKVHRRQNKERNRMLREKQKGMCERCKTRPKWSSNPTAKYCLECKQIMKSTTQKVKEEEKKKQRINIKEKRARYQEKISVDPTKQKPTIKEPVKTKKGEINPYFLRRHT